MFGEACLSCTRATSPLVKDFLARRSRAETPSPTQRLPESIDPSQPVPELHMRGWSRSQRSLRRLPGRDYLVSRRSGHLTVTKDHLEWSYSDPLPPPTVRCVITQSPAPPVLSNDTHLSLVLTRDADGPRLRAPAVVNHLATVTRSQGCQFRHRSDS
jgi:hypothetical protein